MTKQLDGTVVTLGAVALLAGASVLLDKKSGASNRPKKRGKRGGRR